EVIFTTAEGVEPRFYAISPTEFVVDIDTASPPANMVTVEQLATAAPGTVPALAEPVSAMTAETEVIQTGVVPYVTTSGSTVRLVFPFEADVATAVFRRGQSLWMVFDTAATIT